MPSPNGTNNERLFMRFRERDPAVYGRFDGAAGHGGIDFEIRRGGIFRAPIRHLVEDRTANRPAANRPVGIGADDDLCIVLKIDGIGGDAVDHACEQRDFAEIGGDIAEHDRGLVAVAGETQDRGFFTRAQPAWDHVDGDKGRQVGGDAVLTTTAPDHADKLADWRRGAAGGHRQLN